MTKSSKQTKVDFLTMSPTEVFDHFGGELLRGNVSRTIRELSNQGLTRAQIAKVTGKRYQHVRNVLTEPAKK